MSPSSQPPERERWYTPEEIADKLRISPKTVRNYLRAKKLGGIKFGKTWRVSDADLQEFIRRARPT